MKKLREFLASVSPFAGFNSKLPSGIGQKSLEGAFNIGETFFGPAKIDGVTVKLEPTA